MFNRPPSGYEALPLPPSYDEATGDISPGTTLFQQDEPEQNPLIRGSNTIFSPNAALPASSAHFVSAVVAPPRLSITDIPTPQSPTITTTNPSNFLPFPNFADLNLSALDFANLNFGFDPDDDLALEELARNIMGELDIEEPANLRQRPSLISRYFPFTSSPSAYSPSTFFPTSLSSRLQSMKFSFALPKFPTLPESISSIMPTGGTIAKLFGLALLTFSIYALFYFNFNPSSDELLYHFDLEAVQLRIEKEVSATRIADSLKYITSFDHAAGTRGDWYLGKWIRDSWEGSLDKVDVLQYDISMNYAIEGGQRVALIDKEGVVQEIKISHSGSIGKIQQTLPWFSGAKSGNVTGHLIYANGGSRDDFKQLQDMGIEVKGAVVLVRHNKGQSDVGLKVKAAAMAGAVGCLVYSDAKIVEGKVQDGPAGYLDSIQRDNVVLTNWILGDYRTPEIPSVPSTKRLENPLGLTEIPSLPLSYVNAQTLLKQIQNSGKEIPQEWKDDGSKGWTGSMDGPKVVLENNQDETDKQAIWDVRGSIIGVESPESRIMVGNHRDAWCLGAVDPGSGTAILMEVVEIFASLKRAGWKPLRTIEFLSWDAGKFNLAGSTEYVEDHVADLRKHGVAYINVGAGISGTQFKAGGSPLFKKSLQKVLGRVEFAQKRISLTQDWDATYDGLGSEGDSAAFQAFAGVSSLDLSFVGEQHDYPQGTCYDTFDWITNYGDNEFTYHKALAHIWALMILELADRPILPLDLPAFAERLNAHVNDLANDTNAFGLDISSLTSSAVLLKNNADVIAPFEKMWESEFLAKAGYESRLTTNERLTYNNRLVRLEKDLLDLPGIFSHDTRKVYGVSKIHH